MVNFNYNQDNFIIVEEVNPKTIKSIEFEDSDNQTLAYEGTDIQFGISKTRSPNKCLHLLKNFSKPITLRLNFNETERHITHIELTLLDTNEYKKNYIKEIKSINVSICNFTMIINFNYPCFLNDQGEWR